MLLAQIELTQIMFDLGAEMEIDMQVSILGTKYMDLVCITLPMVTVMREHGMKGVGKVLACILFELVREDMANGMLATSNTLYHNYLMLSLEQFRCFSLTFQQSYCIFFLKKLEYN